MLSLLSCDGAKQSAEGMAQTATPLPASQDSPQGETDAMEANSVPSAAVPAHLDTAFAYIDVRDGGDNDSPSVNRFLASVGLGSGYPWCAAFVSYCLEQSAERIAFPEVRSALATDFITRRSVKASRVMMGLAEVDMGSVLIWRKGNGMFGHAGFVEAWGDKQSGCGRTIEGNTSRPQSAESKAQSVEDERDGEGVFRKERCISPGDYFRIVSFTGVVYTGAE